MSDFDRRRREGDSSLTDRVVQRSVGKRTAVQKRYGQVQRKETAKTDQEVGEAAERGIAGGGGPLPYIDQIQRSFGEAHDLSGVKAHVGGEAAEASASMGAEGYATGND